MVILNRSRRGRRRLLPTELSRWLRCAAPGVRQPPRVLLAGKLTALAAPGGGETQLLAMARELREAGIDARLWRPWEQRLSDAQGMHLFGSEPEHLSVVEAARRQGLPVALSPIAWFALGDCLREPRPWSWRLAAAGKFLARASLPRLPSWRRRLYHAVDLLLPNSQAEAEQLVRYFHVPPERIRVVPNGAELRFAHADAEPFARLAGGQGFALYAGRIEPRKNQLAFLKAMRGTGVRSVVLGDVVPGHESYLDACRRAADENVRFVGRLPHDDPLLASAYAACGCLALCSWYETPGLVALEAGMSGVPLVLPSGGCAAEYFGELAQYVHPHDLRGIRAAVLAALQQGRNPDLARLVQTRYTWRQAAQVTREAYAQLLS